MLSYANQAKNEITRAQARPERPMSVSIMVQDLRVVFSSISRNEEHIQKTGIVDVREGRGTAADSKTDSGTHEH